MAHLRRLLMLLDVVGSHILLNHFNRKLRVVALDEAESERELLRRKLVHLRVLRSVQYVVNLDARRVVLSESELNELAKDEGYHDNDSNDRAAAAQERVVRRLLVQVQLHRYAETVVAAHPTPALSPSCGLLKVCHRLARSVQQLL